MACIQQIIYVHQITLILVPTIVLILMEFVHLHVTLPPAKASVAIFAVSFTTSFC